MEIKIFSAIVTDMVESVLSKLENQIENYIRDKQVVSVNQSVIQATNSSEKSRIIITVVTK